MFTSLRHDENLVIHETTNVIIISDSTFKLRMSSLRSGMERPLEREFIQLMLCLQPQSVVLSFVFDTKSPQFIEGNAFAIFGRLAHIPMVGAGVSMMFLHSG